MSDLLRPLTCDLWLQTFASAFSFAEFRMLAERAGWKNFGQAKFAFARQAIWLE